MALSINQSINNPKTISVWGLVCGCGWGCFCLSFFSCTKVDDK